MVKKDYPGIAYEIAVATIQKRFDPFARVRHNEIIVDRIGHRRQFDVVIRGSFSGQPMLGVIECKDTSRKVGTPEIDAFITKANDINANFKIIVSRHGFSKNALEKCKHYGIKPLSLVTYEYFISNISIGKNDLALYEWSRVFLKIEFTLNKPQFKFPMDASCITIGGQPVVDWFVNKMIEKTVASPSFEGPFVLHCRFDGPVMIGYRDEWLAAVHYLQFASERKRRIDQSVASAKDLLLYDWIDRKIFLDTLYPTEHMFSLDKKFREYVARQEKGESVGLYDLYIDTKISNIKNTPDAIDLDQVSSLGDC
jgi:hypothetical protein